ncbi:MAG TPA: sensor histidine kinase [Longimicrobium sp.]|jgi:two-component system sensor histidine kinase DesK|uniref:sensor histidine kinase n=1 Tax=Longimicrobium sp. TaxID=2029185 RepID=UPI002EDA6929
METGPAAAPASSPRRRLVPAGGGVGWTAYAWLIYLAFFLIEPAVPLRLAHSARAYPAGTALVVAVFLVSYFRGFWVQGRALMLVVAVQVLLGAVMTPLNVGASVFFIYAASFAGNLAGPRVAARAIVIVAAAGAATSWLAQPPLWYWFPAVGMPLLIGFVNLHYAQEARVNARLKLAHEQIRHLAAVAERERIGRDLHDVLGHTLSLIVLKSELASKLATRDVEAAAREIREVEQVARKALREVREAVRGYRASLDDEARQSAAILAAAGIRATVDVPPVTLEREVEESLALALREAVTNVVRHSEAQACSVRLRREPGGYVLEVEDDGRAGAVTEGSGLRGMRERVEAAGGTMMGGAGIGGRGVRISVRVPDGLGSAANAGTREPGGGG